MSLVTPVSAKAHSENHDSREHTWNWWTVQHVYVQNYTQSKLYLNCFPEWMWQRTQHPPAMCDPGLLKSL